MKRTVIDAKTKSGELVRIVKEVEMIPATPLASQEVRNIPGVTRYYTTDGYAVNYDRSSDAYVVAGTGLVAYGITK